MTHISASDLIRFRLLAHGLLADGSDDHAAPGVSDVARRMLAIQAQDYGHAGWALGIRTADATAHDVADAFTSRELVRSWPMRGTLHIVPAIELGWMLDLTTTRMLARTRTRRRQLELDDATLLSARDVAIAVLSGGRALSRAGLLSAFESAGIGTARQRGYHLIYHLAQTGTLVWGPPDKNQQALVLSDEWITQPHHRETDEALGAFVRGYLDGHGPATLGDFVWWSGLTVSQAKTARAVAGPALSEVELGDETYLLPHDLADADAPVPPSHVHALPGFDEYFLGYRDRSVVVDSTYAPRVVPGNNGVFKPTIASRGRIVGTWRKAGNASSSMIEAEPFTTLTSREQAAFATSARRFARFHTR